MAGPPYEVVVLAGGQSRRFGSDKLVLLLDSVLAGLPVGPTVVCVGPALPTPSRAVVSWVREEPVSGGPLAGVAAGLAALSPGTAVVVLVGGDMPRAGAAVPALVATLEAAPPEIDAALLLDAAGRRQPLASAWRRDRLAAALAAVGDPAGVRLHRLLDGVRLLELPDRWDAARDVDTPADWPLPPPPPPPRPPKPTGG